MGPKTPVETVDTETSLSPSRSRSSSILGASQGTSHISSPPSMAALRDAQRRAANNKMPQHRKVDRRLEQKPRPRSVPNHACDRGKHVLRCEPLKELLFPTSKHGVSTV